MAEPNQSDDDDRSVLDVDQTQEQQDEGHTPPVKQPSTQKRKQSYLASHKIIEKKRRDRINTSLHRLRSMVPDCAQYIRGNGKKLDKAEILESTIGYIERLQRLSSSNRSALTSPQGEGEANETFQQPSSEESHRSKMHQWIRQVANWTRENYQNAISVESFAEQLIRKLNEMAMASEDGRQAVEIVSTAEKSEFLGNIASGRHQLIVTPPLPPVLQGSNQRTFLDPMAPPLLPVVPPRPAPAFPTSIFPPQHLRISPNPNALPDQMSEILWPQAPPQALLMQTVRPHQPVSLGSVLTSTNLASQPPQVVIHQAELPVSHGVPQVRSERQNTRRVTFPPTAAKIERESNADIFQPRPNRLLLGAPSSNSTAMTPTTPHGGNYSSVSTPHGANTPAGEATPLNLCSPTAVKQFPDSSTFHNNHMDEQLTQQVPSSSPLTSPRPTPRSLPLAPMQYAASNNPLSPSYSNTTAITPQRQIYAHSLLELAQTEPPRTMHTRMGSVSQADNGVSVMPTQGLQAPPLITSSDDGLQPLPDMATPGQSAHISGQNMLPGLNAQQNMISFASPVQMPDRSSSYHQLHLPVQPLAIRSQPVLSASNLPISDTGSSENLLTTPCDPNMGAPPNLTEDDLDVVPHRRTTEQSHGWGDDGSNDSSTT